MKQSRLWAAVLAVCLILGAALPTGAAEHMPARADAGGDSVLAPQHTAPAAENTTAALLSRSVSNAPYPLQLETASFRFYAESGDAAALNELSARLESFCGKLEQDFGFRPETGLDVIVYPSVSALHVGVDSLDAPDTAVATVRDGKIHIVSPSNLGSAVSTASLYDEAEYMTAWAYTLSRTTSPAMVYGVTLYETERPDGYRVLQALTDDTALPLETLLGSTWDDFSSDPTGYHVQDSALFVRFVSDTMGAAGLRALLSGNDVAEALGMSVSELSSRFLTYLENRYEGSTLSDCTETEHFILHYANPEKDVAECAAKALEGNYARITSALEKTPSGKTVVSIYGSQDALTADYERITGLDASSLLGFEQYNHVYACADYPDVVQSVQHEFVHAVEEQYTGSRPSYLSEGLADFLSMSPYRSHEIRDMLRRDIESGALVDFQNLDSLQNSGDDYFSPYAYGFAFVHFVDSQYGFDAVRRLLAGEKVTDVLGASSSALDAVWKQFLTEQYGPNASAGPQFECTGRGPVRAYWFRASGDWFLETEGTEPVSSILQHVTARPEGASIVVLGPTDTPLASDASCATGQAVQVVGSEGEIIQSVSVVVPGDVIGSGQITLAQLVQIAKALSGREALEGPYLAAADLTGDGVLSISDLVREAQLFRAAA